MRRPTGPEIALSIYALVATFMWITYFNLFTARAEKMNRLTSLLAQHEVKNGCLGEEIDAFFWFSECPKIYAENARIRAR